MERRNVSGFEQLYSSGIGTIGKYMQMKEESKIQVLYVFVSLSHHSAWLHIRRVTCNIPLCSVSNILHFKVHSITTKIILLGFYGKRNI